MENDSKAKRIRNQSHRTPSFNLSQQSSTSTTHLTNHHHHQQQQQEQQERIQERPRTRSIAAKFTAEEKQNKPSITSFTAPQSTESRRSSLRSASRTVAPQYPEEIQSGKRVKRSSTASRDSIGETDNHFSTSSKARNSRGRRQYQRQSTASDQASSTASQRGHSPFSAPATPATAHSVSTNVSVSSHLGQTSASATTRRGSKRTSLSNEGLLASALKGLPTADPLSGVRQSQPVEEKGKGKEKAKSIKSSSNRGSKRVRDPVDSTSATLGNASVLDSPQGKRLKRSSQVESRSGRRTSSKTSKSNMAPKKQQAAAFPGPSKSRTSTSNSTARTKNKSAIGTSSSHSLKKANDSDTACGSHNDHMELDNDSERVNVHSEFDEDHSVHDEQETEEDQIEIDRDAFAGADDLEDHDVGTEGLTVDDEEENEEGIEEDHQELEDEDDYEDEEDDHFDDDGDDPYGDGEEGGGFGGHIRIMAGYMSGLSGRFRALLNSLRDRKDPTSQLVALQELSEVLSISNEDTLAGYFPTESFVGELIYLMGGPKPLRSLSSTKEKSKEDLAQEEEDEDAFAAALALEGNSETMLLACRCIANLIEAMPYAAHSVVSHGAVPVLNAKLVQIEFIDLAEQVLQTMEKISNEFPSAIVREGGLSAMLQYLDFFNIHVQRTAMNAAANCCRRLSVEQFDKAKEVMPIIKNVLSYSDQRLVESACRCIVRLIDSYRHHTDLLEQLLSDEVVGSINGILLPGSSSSSTGTTISSTIYTEILKGLGTAARVSPTVAVTLLENNIVETLYVLLTGSTAPTEDGKEGEGPAVELQGKDEIEANVEDNAGAAFAIVNADGSDNVAIADVAILQNLAQRPKDQVQEALSLVAELLPPLPREGIFDPRQYTERAYIRRKAKAQKIEKRSSGQSSASNTGMPAKETPNNSEENQTDPNASQPVQPSAHPKSERVKSERELSREKAQVRRIAALREKKALVKRFTQLVLPTLVEVYAASVGWSIRSKALYGILKIVSFVDPEPLLQSLDTVPLASFVASILSSRDHAMLVQGALQLVELLTTKLPDVYSSLLRREGVMWEIEDIASKEPVGKGKDSKEKGKSEQDKVTSEQQSEQPDQNSETVSSTAPSGSMLSGDEFSHLSSIALPTSNLSRLLAVTSGMQSGTLSSRIRASNSTRSIIPSGSPGMATVGGQMMSATDAEDSNIWRARILCDSLSPKASKASAGGADEAGRALSHIQDLVNTLKDDTDEDRARSTLNQIAELFYKTDKPISSFELLRSGLVDGLYEFATGNSDILSRMSRESLLAQEIMQNEADPNKPSAASVLVRKLQETLSRLEDMDITTAIYNNEEVKRSPTANVARQVRLKLVAEGSDLGDIPRNCTDIVVSIHAITSFQSLHDYLRPKISASQSSSSLKASSSNPGPSSGFSSMLESLASNAGIELTSAFRESLRAAASASASGTPSGSVATSKPLATSAEAGSSTTNEDTKKSSGSSRRRSSRLTSKSITEEGNSKQKEEETRDEDPENEVEMDEEALTRKFVEGLLHGDMDGLEGDDAFSDDYDEEFVDEDSMPGLNSTSLSAAVGDDTIQVDVAPEGESKVTDSSSNGDDTSLSKSAPSGLGSGLLISKSSASSSPSKISYANALQKRPVDWHLQFEMDGEKVSLNSTIYSAIHKHEMRFKSLHPSSTTAARHVWANTYTVKYRKMPGPQIESSEKSRATPDPSSSILEQTGLPDSISPKATYASILLLLRALYKMNRQWKESRDWRKVENNHSANALNEAAFVNNKLTAKLNRQLEEPMIVASNCMPSWSLDLPRAFPFLFPFEARYAFLQSTSFGYHRLINRWQTQQSRNQDGSAARHDDSLALLGRLTRQKVRISRTNILASAFKVFELYGTNSSLLEVEYFDEVGTGLGPTLEFYAMVSKEFAKKSTSMWRSDEGRSGESEYVHSVNGLFPAPIRQEDADSEKGAGGNSRTHSFKILGQFVAKALFDSRIVDMDFSTMFMRLVLNEHVPNTMEMLRQVDATLAQSLEKLKALQNDELESLSLDFTLPGYANYELHPDGKDETVSSTNLQQYIDEVITHTLTIGVKPLIRAFRQGFNLIFPISAMSTFTPEEVVMLFGNQEEDWSETTLLSSIKPDHGYNVDSSTFRDVISVMAGFTIVERRDFLQWLTGSPKLPIGGFVGLHPQLTIVKRTPDANQSADQTLPSVMTCVNFCKMPPFSTRAIMKERLSLAMREGQASFHLS